MDVRVWTDSRLWLYSAMTNQLAVVPLGTTWQGCTVQYSHGVPENGAR
jgi:hypothetical protein